MDLGSRRIVVLYVAEIKVLTSCMFTAQLIYAFIFPYAKSRFSHYRLNEDVEFSCYFQDEYADFLRDLLNDNGLIKKVML